MGAVKFFCLFRAAILSAKELNCGSSVSAIVMSKISIEVSEDERLMTEYCQAEADSEGSTRLYERLSPTCLGDVKTIQERGGKVCAC